MATNIKFDEVMRGLAKTHMVLNVPYGPLPPLGQLSLGHKGYFKQPLRKTAHSSGWPVQGLTLMLRQG